MIMESVDDPGDSDYVVTADMLIHEDIDDERTLEEDEEAEESAYEDELQDLQKEQEMPLEELLASYYSGANVEGEPEGEPDDVTDDVTLDGNNNGTAKEDQSLAQASSSPLTVEAVTVSSPVHVPPDLLLPPGLMEEEEDLRPVANPSSRTTAKPPNKPPNKKKGPWFRSGANPEALARLRPVPERLSLKVYAEGNQKILDSTFNHWLTAAACDDSSSDDDYSSSWRKEIKVGRDHQATVPPFARSLPSASERRLSKDQLIWSPRVLSESAVTDYLIRVNNRLQDKEGLPNGSTDRDNEHALRTLQSHDHDVHKAERVFNQGVSRLGMSPWSEEERKKFESGLKSVGKDFHSLQKQIPSRSVKELIEYYYLWKKTEHYDTFLQNYGKMGKKKFSLPPGYLSDFMSDLLEPSRTDYPELHYGTTTLSAEIKKDRHASSQVDDRLRHAHHSKSIATKTS